MCHANLDPKLALRDAEARLQGVSFHAATKDTPLRAPVFGLLARVRAGMAWLMRKEVRDV